MPFTNTIIFLDLSKRGSQYTECTKPTVVSSNVLCVLQQSTVFLPKSDKELYVGFCLTKNNLNNKSQRVLQCSFHSSFSNMKIELNMSRYECGDCNTLLVTALSSGSNARRQHRKKTDSTCYRKMEKGRNLYLRLIERFCSFAAGYSMIRWAC